MSMQETVRNFEKTFAPLPAPERSLLSALAARMRALRPSDLDRSGGFNLASPMLAGPETDDRAGPETEDRAGPETDEKAGPKPTPDKPLETDY